MSRNRERIKRAAEKVGLVFQDAWHEPDNGGEMEQRCPSQWAMEYRDGKGNPRVLDGSSVDDLIARIEALNPVETKDA